MESKLILCLTLFCLLGSVITAPAPTFVIAAPAAAATTVTVSGSGVLLGSALLGKALLAKGLILGAALAN